MRKPRNIFSIGLVSCLLVGFAWQVLHPHEIEYGGKPLSFWLRNVHWETEARNRLAREVVLKLGTNALPDLVEMAAASVPWRWPERLKEIAPSQSLDFLRLPETWDNERAAWAFQVLGPQGRSAVPALIRLLTKKDKDVQCSAIKCLAALGPTAQEAVPALILLLRGTNSEARFHAVYCLAQMGAAAEQSVPALIDVLEEVRLRPPWPLRTYDVIYALGRMGPCAHRAVPALRALTNASAQAALILITGESPIPFVDQLRDTSNPRRWVQVAGMMSWLGTNAVSGIPHLVSALVHTNDNIQNQARDCLAALHVAPETQVPILTHILQSTNPTECLGALNALRRIGPKARLAVPEVAPLLHDPREQVRETAKLTLSQIDMPDSTQALQAIR